ncbi:MAG: phosphoribosylamine--glycine ligase [Vampirovibrionales bacterium]
MVPSPHMTQEVTYPKTILILGGGGREHAIGWKLKQQHPELTLYFMPGNAGTRALGTNLHGGWDTPEARQTLVETVKNLAITFVIAGPEAPLVAGVIDILSTEGILAFGPKQAAAELEASKSFAKAIMEKANVPTARYVEVPSMEEAPDLLKTFTPPYVIKEDGLAAGKGVTVTASESEALHAIEVGLAKGQPNAPAKVIIEAFLQGEELSVLAMCDGYRAVPLVSAQDFKRAYDGHEGPNTGGMGSYAPVPFVDDTLMQKVQARVLQPMLDTMRAEGKPFQGILYAGLMIDTHADPYVIEFNVRFGDPETQAVLPVLEADLLHWMVESAQGHFTQAMMPPAKQCAVSVVVATGNYPAGSQTGLGMSFPEKLPKDVMIFHAGTRFIEEASPQVQTAGGRVVNVTGLGATLKEAREKAYQVVPHVMFEGARFRTDIALQASQYPSL